MKKYNSRWYVEVVDDSYPCQSIRRIYVPLAYEEVDYFKCLKKLWKRISRQCQGQDKINVLAYVESEDGGDVSEISCIWEYQTLDCMEMVGLFD